MQNEDKSAKRGGGLGFSVAALLLLVTAVCVAFGIWNATRREVTTAFLEVRYPVGATATPQEVERLNSTQLALFRSSAVVAEVFANPQIQQLPSVSRQNHPEVWLLSRLETSFASDSPILQLRLEGRHGEGAADAEILRALIDAQKKSAASMLQGGSSGATVRIIQAPVVSTR
jgi:hypothetical protein